MAIKNLADKVTADDVAKTQDKHNPPEFDPGFEPTGGGDDWGGLFDEGDTVDTSDLFSDFKPAGDTSGGFGQQQGGFGQTGMAPLGGGTPLGGGAFANPFASPFAQQQQQQPTQPPPPDAFDKLMDMSGNAIVAMGHIIVSMWNSVSTRTADDLGYFSRNAAITAGGLIGAGIVLFLIGVAAKVPQLGFTRLPLQLLLAGALVLGSSIIGISAAALSITFKGSSPQPAVQDIPDVEELPDEVSSIDDDLTDTLAAMFGEEDEEEESFDFEPEPEPVEEEPEVPEPVDIEEHLKTIQSNVPILSREVLFNTFKPLFPCNTPGFAAKKEIEKGTQQFFTLETLCMKALAAAGKVDVDDLEPSLERAVESYYTYDLRIKRIRNMNKLDDIEREMKAYFSESSDDDSVSCKVDLEGDFYKVILNKGVSAVVTFGDVFKLQEAVDFYLNTKNQLPMVAGITEDGQPLLVDAKNFDTMLIAGRPRSGKSWYVLSILESLMAFNSPETVQLLIIDPKESNLFKTLALMPHVCGLHNDSDILNILKELIEFEGARRKKLLADNRCENIWDLRKKGIDLPVLYIVIDEYMTVMANLSEPGKKDFQEQIKVIISQLPSLGIRLIFVPHRSQGVVDKTARVNIAFTAAVRAETQVILETLDIKKWTTPLLNQGDIALKMQGMGRERLVRGLAMTTSDGDNTELIMGIARAFYKMGCVIPDMTSIGRGFNRDEDFIREELNQGGSTNKRIQFDDSDKSLDELMDEANSIVPDDED